MEWIKNKYLGKVEQFCIGTRNVRPRVGKNQELET
jgi:hypothetical protein